MGRDQKLKVSPDFFDGEGEQPSQRQFNLDLDLLLGEPSTLVDDCPRPLSILDSTNEAMDARILSYFEVFVFPRIEVDVKTIWLWVLPGRHASAKQCKCDSGPFRYLQVLVVFGKFDRYKVFEYNLGGSYLLLG